MTDYSERHVGSWSRGSTPPDKEGEYLTAYRQHAGWSYEVLLYRGDNWIAPDRNHCHAPPYWCAIIPPEQQ